MAVSLRAVGAQSSATAAVTAVTVSTPAGTTVGDLALLSVVVKPYNATITTPSGWTKITEATNGTVAAGNDVGSMKIALYYRTDVGAAVATGNIGQTSANSMGAAIVVYQKGATEFWDVTSFTDGGDTTNAANFSATGAADIGLRTGDWLFATAGVNSDAGTPSAAALTATGATLTPTTSRAAYSFTTGFDSRLIMGDAPVTAGTSSAAPALVFTNASSSSGEVIFLRIRAGVMAGTVAATSATAGAPTKTGEISLVHKQTYITTADASIYQPSFTISGPTAVNLFLVSAENSSATLNDATLGSTTLTPIGPTTANPQNAQAYLATGIAAGAQTLDMTFSATRTGLVVHHYEVLNSTGVASSVGAWTALSPTTGTSADVIRLPNTIMVGVVTLGTSGDVFTGGPNLDQIKRDEGQTFSSNVMYKGLNLGTWDPPPDDTYYPVSYSFSNSAGQGLHFALTQATPASGPERRWTGNGLAEGVAVTSVNVNTAGNGDLIGGSQGLDTGPMLTEDNGFNIGAPTGVISRIVAHLTAGTTAASTQVVYRAAQAAATSALIVLASSGGTTVGGLVHRSSDGKLGLYGGNLSVLSATSSTLPLVDGHDYVIDFVIQKNGDAAYRVRGITDPSYYFQYTGTDVDAGAVDVERIYFGRSSTSIVTPVKMQYIGWQEVAIPGGETLADQYMSDPYVLPKNYAAAGISAAVSTTAGAATVIAGPVQHVAAGTVAAVATTAGTVTERAQVSGTVAAVAAQTGTATLRSQASGTVAAVSVNSGTVTERSQAAGTITSTSATAGAATVVSAGTQYAAAGTVGAVSNITGPASYSSYRLQPTALRDAGTANSVAISEFQVLYNGTNQSGNWLGIFDDLGGESGSEGPIQANDGSFLTKWMDFRKTAAYIYVVGVSKVNINAVRIGTAMDAPERDPVQFDLYGAYNSGFGSPGTWELIGSFDWTGTDPGRGAYVTFPIVANPSATNRVQVSGAVTVTSSTSGDATVSAKAAAGTVTAVSAALGAITYRTNVTGTTVTALSVVAGTLSRRQAGAGTVSAVSTVSGAPNKRNFLINEYIDAVSTVLGSLTRLQSVSGTSVTATSTTFGQLSSTQQLSGTSAATSATAGDVTVTAGTVMYQVAGTSVAKSTVRGPLPTYSSYRFQTTAIRDAPFVQISEFQVLQDGVRQTGASGHLFTSGLSYAAASINDNDVATYYENGNGTNGYFYLVFPSAVTADGVRIATSNGHNSRDPIAFDIYGSNDTVAGTPGTWTLLASHTVASDPGRMTYLPDYSLVPNPRVSLRAQVSTNTNTWDPEWNVHWGFGARSNTSGSIFQRAVISGTVAAEASVNYAYWEYNLFLRMVVFGTTDAVSTTIGDLTKFTSASGTVSAVSNVTGSASQLNQAVSGTVTAVSTTVGLGTKLTQASGAVTAVSTSSGAVTAILPGAAGIVAAVSAQTGTVTRQQYLTGTPITGVSTVTGAATKTAYAVSGTVAAVGATIGTATKTSYIATSTITAVSTTAGTLTLRSQADSISAAVSTTVGTVTGRLPAAGTVSQGVSTNAGSITAVFQVSSTVTAVSTVVGSIVGIGTVNAIADAVSTVSGAVTKTPYVAAGIVAATSTTNGAATKTPYVAAGIVTAVSAVIGNANKTSYVASGIVTAVSTTAGALTSALPTSGIVAANSAVTGTSTLRQSVSGIVTAESTVAGDLTLRTQLTGGFIAESSTFGEVTATLPATSGPVQSVSTVSGDPTKLTSVSGTVDAVSDTIGDVIEVSDASGSVTALANTSGNITLTGQVDGIVSAVSATAGTVYKSATLSGTVAAVSTVSGTVTARYALLRAVAAVSATTGNIRLRRQASGVIAAVSTTSGTLGLRQAISGTANAVSDSLGDIVQTFLVSSETVIALSTTYGTANPEGSTSGVVNADAAVSGTVTAKLTVEESAVDAVSTTAGDVRARFALAQTVTALSNVVGAVVKRTQAAGIVTAISTVSGTPTKRTQASGTVAVTATISGTVTNRSQVSGTVAPVSGTTGELSAQSEAEGEVFAISSTLGAVNKITNAIGAIASVSAVAGELTSIRQLASRSSALAEAHGKIGLNAAVSGLAAAISEVEGNADTSAALYFTYEGVPVAITAGNLYFKTEGQIVAVGFSIMLDGNEVGFWA